MLTFCCSFQADHIKKDKGVQAEHGHSAQPPSKALIQIHKQVEVQNQHTQERTQYLHNTQGG